MNTIFSLHSSIYSSVILPEIYNIINIAKANSFYIPQSRIFALNKLVKKLKYYGIWNRLDDLWIGVYNDSNSINFTRISLKINSIATLGSTLGYNVNGWKGDGLGTGDFNTGFLYTYATKLTVGNSNLTALVNNVSDCTNASDSLISSANSNTSEIWSAWNTNLHRQLSSSNLSTNADLSGVGFKTFSKIGDNCTLYNRNTQILRTQANNISLPPQPLIFMRNSTTRYSKIGLSMLSIGSNLVGLEMIYRDILNEYLTEIGLTAYA